MPKAETLHVVWYLEMTGRSQLVRKTIDLAGTDFSIVRVDDYVVNKTMYEKVGGLWKWRDRLVWSLEQWKAYAGRADIETLVAQVDGEAVGYAELRYDLPKEIQIEYFGLLPGYYGKGYGGYFLSEVVDACWEQNPGRIWLHTCSYDGPTALPNYLKRGFVVFAERRFEPGEEIVE